VHRYINARLRLVLLVLHEFLFLLFAVRVVISGLVLHPALILLLRDGARHVIQGAGGLERLLGGVDTAAQRAVRAPRGLHARLEIVLDGRELVALPDGHHAGVARRGEEVRVVGAVLQREQLAHVHGLVGDAARAVALGGLGVHIPDLHGLVDRGGRHHAGDAGGETHARGGLLVRLEREVDRFVLALELVRGGACGAGAVAHVDADHLSVLEGHVQVERVEGVPGEGLDVCGQGAGRGGGGTARVDEPDGLVEGAGGQQPRLGGVPGNALDL